MKDLSTYISGTLITDYIKEARTLRDLKGKQVNKIEVDDPEDNTIYVIMTSTDDLYDYLCLACTDEIFEGDGGNMFQHLTICVKRAGKSQSTRGDSVWYRIKYTVEHYGGMQMLKYLSILDDSRRGTGSLNYNISRAKDSDMMPQYANRIAKKLAQKDPNHKYVVVKTLSEVKDLQSKLIAAMDAKHFGY